MSAAAATRSGRPRLSRETQDLFRRQRIVRALAEECVERGYQATTIAHVGARVHFARNTIYAHFPNKEAIFIALLEGAEREVGERVRRACEEAGEDPRRRVQAALAAVLDWVASDPPAARALLVEAPTSPAAFGLQLAMFADFTNQLRQARTPDPERPVCIAELLVDGVASVLRFLLIGGEAERAPSLLPNLCGVLEQPYLEDAVALQPAARPS